MEAETVISTAQKMERERECVCGVCGVCEIFPFSRKEDAKKV
jgi:hypothetical protein